jgi:predicted DNA-binding transcriptional regulator YafY
LVCSHHGRGWGFDFTIRQPPELREALRQQATRLAALADV